MTLPISGLISMSDINDEYALGLNLSNYIGVQWYKPADNSNGIFNTPIAMSQFRGTSPAPPDPLAYFVGHQVILDERADRTYNFTFNNVEPGLLIMSLHAERMSPTMDFPTVTIDGQLVNPVAQRASLLADFDSYGSAQVGLYTYTLNVQKNVPIQIVYPASVWRVGVGLWRLLNIQSPVPYHTDSYYKNVSSTGHTYTLNSLQVPSIGILAVTRGVNTELTSVTGIKDFDIDVYSGPVNYSRFCGLRLMVDNPSEIIAYTHTSDSQIAVDCLAVWK